MESLTHQTLHSQSIARLPREDRNSMWGYYQGTQYVYRGETDQGWAIYITIVRADPWIGGAKLGTTKKLPPFTMIDSIVLESPDEVRFSFTAWKRQNESTARTFPHVLDIKATEFDIAARVNKWLGELSDYEDLNGMDEDYYDNYYQECPVVK